MGSATRGKATQTPLGDYPTPPATASDLLRTLPPLAPGSSVLEPTAGEGTWLRMLAEQLDDPKSVTAVGVELNRRYVDLLRTTCLMFGEGSFSVLGQPFDLWTPPRMRFDRVVGNPPFAHAETIIRHALFLLRPGGVAAFLLRAGFQFTQERARWRRRVPVCREYRLDQRVSFDGNGTDGTEYSLQVWKKGYTGPTICRSLNLADPQMLAADLAVIRRDDWPVLLAA